MDSYLNRPKNPKIPPGWLAQLNQTMVHHVDRASIGLTGLSMLEVILDMRTNINSIYLDAFKFSSLFNRNQDIPNFGPSKKKITTKKLWML